MAADGQARKDEITGNPTAMGESRTLAASLPRLCWKRAASPPP
jgi:hypothetical protein